MASNAPRNPRPVSRVVRRFFASNGHIAALFILVEATLVVLAPPVWVHLTLGSAFEVLHDVIEAYDHVHRATDTLVRCPGGTPTPEETPEC